MGTFEIVCTAAMSLIGIAVLIYGIKKEGVAYTSFAIGALAVCGVCSLVLGKLHTYVTAITFIATEGASAKFCESVATAVVLAVCALVIFVIRKVFVFIKHKKEE